MAEQVKFHRLPVCRQTVLVEYGYPIAIRSLGACLVCMAGTRSRAFRKNRALRYSIDDFAIALIEASGYHSKSKWG